MDAICLDRLFSLPHFRQILLLLYVGYLAWHWLVRISRNHAQNSVSTFWTHMAMHMHVMQEGNILRGFQSTSRDNYDPVEWENSSAPKQNSRCILLQSGRFGDGAESQQLPGDAHIGGFWWRATPCGHCMRNCIATCRFASWWGVLWLVWCIMMEFFENI